MERQGIAMQMYMLREAGGRDPSCERGDILIEIPKDQRPSFA
jgi:hypothetical protein